MGIALAVTIEYTEIVCGECSIHFHVPEHWRTERKQTGATFYCPNGHPRAYCESDLERTRKLLAEANDKNTRLAARLHTSEVAVQSAMETAAKLKKRLGAGCCPCCKRTFKQLAAHMKKQHPNFGERK